MYKLLIFDADYTLFDFDKAEKNALTRVSGDFGKMFDDNHIDLYKQINMSLWKKFEKNEISQNKIKTERFRIFFERAGIEADFHEGADKYLFYLSQGCCLLPGAGDLILNLKNKYKLGLLTNGISNVQHPRLENSALSDVFDAVVVSGDVGISKPNPKIFKIVAEKAGFKDKSEMLMIGDSLTSDIKGGINYGIDTCWYNPKNKSNLTDVKPKYEIDELTELYNILKEVKPS